MVVVEVSVVFIVVILTVVLFFAFVVVDFVEDAHVASPVFDGLRQPLQGDVGFVGVQLEGLQDVL